jgi:uncharacterized membrane protein
MGKLFGHLRARFVAGLCVVVPLGITIFILKFLFNFADGILGPILAKGVTLFTGYTGYIPGLGMLTGTIVVYLAGVLAANVIGRRLFSWGEGLMARIPLVKSIYLSSKQLIDVFREGKSSYRRAVMVQWPRPGVRAVGFVTAEVERNGENYLVVFIPTMPNPTSGFALFFSPSDVEESGMTVEEAIRFVVSGGVVVS